MVNDAGGFGGEGTYVWIMQWWPYALTHGLNPFIEQFTLFPYVQNLAWAAVGLSGPAIALAPITLALGPVVSTNVLAVLAAPTAALATFLVIRYLSHDWIASMLGGYVFGFSSYMIGQLIGQPNLYLVFPMPLAILLALILIDERIRLGTFIVALAALLVVQFSVSLETFFTMTFFGSLTLGIAYVMFRRTHATRLKMLLRGVVGAYVLCGVVVSPFLYYLIQGLGQIPGIFNPTTLYSADLLNYFVPTPITLIGGSVLAHLSAMFPGNYAEEGAYVGLPALVLVAIYVIRGWEQRSVRFIGIMLVVFWMASLGPVVHVAGIEVVDGPWAVLSHVPLLRQALPMRFTLFFSLALGIAVGLFVHKYHRKWTAYALAMIVVVAILPNTGLGYWKSKTIDASLFTTGAYKRYIRPGSSVMVLPFAYNGPGMFYQAMSGFAFKLNDGFIGYNPNSIFHWPMLVETFYDNVKPLPGFRNELMCYMSKTRVNDVVVAGQSAQRTYDRYLKGFDRRVQGDSQVYAVPAQLSKTYANCRATGLGEVVKLLQSSGKTSHP